MLKKGIVRLTGATESARINLAFQHDRPFRMVVLLAVVFVLNMFDLAFTQTQLIRGNFAEANVFATAAVDHGPAGIAAYKVLLFGAGAVILYRCRRHWQSEAGAWVLLTCYSALMVRWMIYLSIIEVCISDPVVGAPPLLY